jgi:hypothetical protein
VPTPISPTIPVTQTLTPAPTPPAQRTDPVNFRARADLGVAWAPVNQTEMGTLTTQFVASMTRVNLNATEAYANASEANVSSAAALASQVSAAASAATAINAPGTAGTSTTSLLIQLGSRVFTTQTGKSFVAGQIVLCAATTGNYMLGQISSYTSGTGALDVFITTLVGSGTFASWTISVSAFDAATNLAARLPNARPVLLNDFARSGVLPSDFVLTRASTATRVDRAGKIEALATSVAALDFDPFTGSAKGLLIEPARTNICKWSSDLTNAAWTKTLVNATASTKTVRGVVMHEIAKNTATANASISQNTAIVSAIGRTDACRFVIMAGTASQLEFGLYNASSPWGLVGDSTAAIVGGPGTLSRTGSYHKLTGLSANLPTEIEVRRTFQNADNIQIYFAPDTFPSTTSGASVLIGLVDLSTTQTAAIGSHVPTTSAAVTRAEASCTRTGLAFSQPWNASGGSMLVVANTLEANCTIWQADAGTNNDRLRIAMVSGAPTFENYVGGVLQASITLAVTGIARNSIAVSFRDGFFCASCNGGAATTVSSGTLGSKTQDRFGSQSAGVGVINGSIERARQYAVVLTAAELQALSGQ